MFYKIGSLLITLLLISITFSVSCGAQSFEGTSLSGTTLPYAGPPFTYKDNRILYVTFKTTPEILRVLIPEPLVPNSDNVMTLYVGKLNVIEPFALNYHEAAIVVPVSYRDKAGNYFVTLYLDTCLGVVGGREIYGFSKFDGKISLTEEDGRILASVERYGTTLVNVTVTLAQQGGPAQTSLALPIFNLKLVPSVEKDAPLDVMQLTSTELKDYKLEEQQSGKATLTLGSSPTDPLGEIPVVEIISSSYRKESFVLDYGEVLYDYLSQDSESTGLKEKKD